MSRMSVCLSACAVCLLSDCLSTNVYMRRLSDCLSVWLSTRVKCAVCCPTVSLSVCLQASNALSVCCPTVSLSDCLQASTCAVCLTVCLSVCLTVYKCLHALSVRLSDCLQASTCAVCPTVCLSNCLQASTCTVCPTLCLSVYKCLHALSVRLVPGTMSPHQKPDDDSQQQEDNSTDDSSHHHPVPSLVLLQGVNFYVISFKVISIVVSKYWRNNNWTTTLFRLCILSYHVLFLIVSLR